MKYRTKPEIIEAVQWFKMGDHEDVKEEYYFKTPGGGVAWDDTHNDEVLVLPGDWIVTDSTGTHVVSDSEFREKYEDVDVTTNNHDKDRLINEILFTLRTFDLRLLSETMRHIRLIPKLERRKTNKVVVE